MKNLKKMWGKTLTISRIHDDMVQSKSSEPYIYSFEDVRGKELPFSLYSFEFELA